MTLQDLIKAVEKASFEVFNGGLQYTAIDADILLAELKKMEE